MSRPLKIAFTLAWLFAAGGALASVILYADSATIGVGDEVHVDDVEGEWVVVRVRDTGMYDLERKSPAGYKGLWKFTAEPDEVTKATR